MYASGLTALTCSADFQLMPQDQYGNVSVDGISADHKVKLEILKMASSEEETEAEDALISDLMCYFTQVSVLPHC